MTDREAVAELVATVAHQQKAIEALTGVVEDLHLTLARAVNCGALLEQQVADLRGRIELIETERFAKRGHNV